MIWYQIGVIVGLFVLMVLLLVVAQTLASIRDVMYVIQATSDDTNKLLQSLELETERITNAIRDIDQQMP